MDAPPVEQQPSAMGSGVVGGPGFFPRNFNRIFTRHMMNAALLVLLVLAISGILHPPKRVLLDSDIWFHLADARILFTTHHFIRVEPYSFTVAGERWTDPEWLAETPFWLGYSWLGLRGIFLVTSLSLYATIVLVYFRGYWISGHAGAAVWTAALGYILMTVNDGPRTIILGYLAMSVELAILEAAERGKTELLWLLPPLFLVWINLHGSWVIGLGLLALYLLCGTISVSKGVFEQTAFIGKDRKRLMLVLFACCAVLWVNPYGWRLIWNPIGMMMNQKLNIATVAEWQPLNLDMVAGKAAVLAIALTIVANCIKGRRWKVYELAFILFAWYAAFAHARFLFLASVITIPMLARDAARSFFAKPNEKTIPAMNALIAAGVVCAVAYFFPNEASMQKDLALAQPVEIVAAIQPNWRTFNVDFAGDFLAFNSKPDFMDTRFDTFEEHGEFRDYLEIMHFHEPFKILDKYRIDHALLVADMPLAFLLEHSPGWRLELREGQGDRTYELFARTSGEGSNQSERAPASAYDNH
jgi:hypothetical protein